jgi:hypothetical protein
MARRRRGIQPKVRLRPLTRSEQRVLREKLRDLRLPARLHRRYQIVAAARETASVPAVAQRVGCDVTTAYDWVARFNASGFTTFERPSNPRGRIPIVTAEQLRELMDVARLPARRSSVTGLASTLSNLGEPRVGRLAIECGVRPERTLA